MTPHTPGPWTHGHVGGDFWVGPNGDGSSILARVAWEFGEIEAGRANARLMAAAPSMLAALESARWTLEKIGTEETHGTIDVIVSAIAKATGDA